MAKEVRYKQCSFTRPIQGGEEVGIAWLPEKFAVAGCQVYFGKKVQESPTLWTVASASDRSVPERYLVEHERDYLSQRQASDI